MLSFTLNDGYYDNGKEMGLLKLDTGDRFIWDLNFTQVGQYYFAIVIDVKSKIKLKKGDFKIGMILDNGPVYIGLSKEIGKVKKGVFELPCGKIIIDDPSIYHVFIESHLSTIEIIKVMIKFFPIPMQGTSLNTKENTKDLIKSPSVILGDSNIIKKHSKVVILKPIDIPVNLWSYYQSFRIIKNYPFTYYAINFGVGNIGIKYNDTILTPLLTLTISKIYGIEIISKNQEFNIINLETSSYLRFEKILNNKLGNLTNYIFLIRVRNIDIDEVFKTEYEFYYGDAEGLLNHVLTIRLKTVIDKKIYEFYIENLGNINGHIYQRQIEVDPAWVLTYDLKSAKALTKNVFILKEQNARCYVKNDIYYDIKYAGLGYSGEQENNLEISATQLIRIPKLGLKKMGN